MRCEVVVEFGVVWMARRWEMSRSKVVSFFVLVPRAIYFHRSSVMVMADGMCRSQAREVWH